MSRAQTVTGPISAEELQLTLPHEHLVCQFTVLHTPSSEPKKRALYDAPITLANHGELMRDWSVSRNNLTMLDVHEAIDELMEFKKMGGSSLVELTALGVGRDPIALQEISRATGINIICCTGFYVCTSHPPIVKEMDIDGVCDFIVGELTQGISHPSDTGSKPGIIKCATLYPISTEEEKVFRGAARAQRKTGAPFTIHPTLRDIENRKKALEHERIIQLIQQEGADLTKFYMSHMDLSCSDDRSRVSVEYHARLMDKYPIILGYDNMGNEAWSNSLWPGPVRPSDNERLLAIVELCERGYEKQLMMSQDIFTKLQRVKYGGWGYGYILKHIVPALRHMGVSQKQITTMMVDNPKRVLTY